MAKKKSKKKEITGLFTYVGVLLSLLLVVVMFLPAIVLKETSSLSGLLVPEVINGSKLAFGGKLTLGLNQEISVNFNFLMLLAYFLPVVVSVLLLLLGKSNKMLEKVFHLLLAASFVFAIVSFSLVIRTSSYVGALGSEIKFFSDDKPFGLGWGSIAGIVISVLGLGAAVYPLVR